MDLVIFAHYKALQILLQDCYSSLYLPHADMYLFIIIIRIPFRAQIFHDAELILISDTKHIHYFDQMI